MSTALSVKARHWAKLEAFRSRPGTGTKYANPKAVPKKDSRGCDSFLKLTCTREYSLMSHPYRVSIRVLGNSVFPE